MPADPSAPSSAAKGMGPPVCAERETPTVRDHPTRPSTEPLASLRREEGVQLFCFLITTAYGYANRFALEESPAARWALSREPPRARERPDPKAHQPNHPRPAAVFVHKGRGPAGAWFSGPHIFNHSRADRSARAGPIAFFTDGKNHPRRHGASPQESRLAPTFEQALPQALAWAQP